MSRWFRHYAGMMRDEKLVAVALRAKQPVERVLWVWGAILESAAEINNGGRYELDTAEVAYFLRADEADICAVLSALADANRVADGALVNWDKRQFQSDKSATRQAAYRQRKRSQGSDGDNRQGDAAVTSLSRNGDAPDTDTETETETDIDDGDARRRTVEKLSEDFYQTIGVDPQNPELYGYAGLPHHVSMWLERGYDRGLILATAADIHARAGPSKPLNYYAKAIENAHVQGPPKAPERKNGAYPTAKTRGSSILDAIDKVPDGGGERLPENPVFRISQG